MHLTGNRICYSKNVLYEFEKFGFNKSRSITERGTELHCRGINVLQFYEHMSAGTLFPDLSVCLLVIHNSVAFFW